MNATRTAGKCGALARDFSVSALTFERYITDVKALPTAPLVTNRTSKVTVGWPMYLNDQLGDCTDAAMLHSVSALSAFSGRVPGGALFDNSVPLRMYEKTGGYVPGNPNTDNGATLQAVCDYMVKTGVKDTKNNLHKLVAYAEVGDPTNLPLLKKILYTFGTVYCAFNIDEAAEDQFGNNQPWVPVPGSPNVGGHCIPLQLSAVSDASYNQYNETWITWGAEQRANEAWVKEQITEAVVLVSEDWIQTNGTSIDGLNINALVADMRTV